MDAVTYLLIGAGPGGSLPCRHWRLDPTSSFGGPLITLFCFMAGPTWALTLPLIIGLFVVPPIAMMMAAPILASV